MAWCFKSKIECGVVQVCRGGTRHDAPKNSGSRLIKLANKEIYKIRGPQIIVAYADENVCEIGTIYQASNALYTGITEPKGQADYILNGTKMSAWKVRKKFGTRDREKLRCIDPYCKVILLHKRHRYVMLAGPKLWKKGIRKQLVRISEPYPKRSELGLKGMVN